MAVSEQTQAIINELKNQGDLIRNSGTNSVRSVKLQMDRFEGLFNSINTNISQQTQILSLQAGIAAEAQERARTQEQFDELNNQRNTNSEQNEESRRGERGDNFIAAAEKIGEKFTLKNMALIAAGGFVTYNLLKGFVTQGIEDNLMGMGDFHKRISSLAEVDIKGTFDTINATMADLQTAIDELKTGVKDTVDKLTSWQYWIGLAISSIGPFMAINYYLKNKLAQRMIDLELAKAQNAKSPTVDPDSPTQPKAPDADPLRTPIGLDADGKPTYADTPDRPAVYDLDGNSIRQPVIPQPIQRGPNGTSDSPTQPRAGSTDARPITPSLDNTPITPDSFSQLTPQQRGSMRPQIAARSGGRVGYNQKAGRFTANPDGTGGFMSDSEAISLMEQTVNPRFAGAYRRVVQLLKIIAPFATAYEIYRFYQVFNDESLDENTRIARLAGILSGFMTGTAMGLLASRATMMFGPWASLISGLIVGISFGFGAEYLTEAIVKWILNKNDDGTIQAELTKQSSIMEQYSDYSNYISAQERLQMGGAPAFADSGYNPEMTNMNLGSYNGVSAGSISDSPYYKGNYYMGKDRQMYFQAPDGTVSRVQLPIRSDATLEGVGVGSGGTTIIHAPQNNVSAPVSMVHGGNQATMSSYGFGEAGRATNNPMGIPGVTSGLVQ